MAGGKNPIFGGIKFRNAHEKEDGPEVQRGTREGFLVVLGARGAQQGRHPCGRGSVWGAAPATPRYR